MSTVVVQIFKLPLKYNATKIYLRRLTSLIIRRHISEMTETREKRETFKGINDRYNGIIVSSDLEKCNGEDFPLKLEESLKQWTDKARRGIWFKVFLDQVDWVPHLVKNGFKYHHAREDYVMMFRWLPKDEMCNIPPYAHTSIGIGSVVVNQNNEVLVVREKYSPISVPSWKLPGGYVEPGENLIDAAIREVMEETGIETEFITLLTLRHAHGGIFGCSDMYFVVALKALSTELKICSRELEDCAWMNIDHYLKHPQVHELNRLFVEKYLEYKKHDLRIECQGGIHSLLKRKYMVYHVIKDKL